MEKWEIRPPLPQKPLNRSSPKFAWVITSGPLFPPKFHCDTIIPLRPPPPNMRKLCENAHQVIRLVFWFFRQPTAKTPAPILTINTSKDVPFWVSRKHNFTFRPHFPPKRKFSANFRRDLENFASIKPYQSDAHL